MTFRDQILPRLSEPEPISGIPIDLMLSSSPIFMALRTEFLTDFSVATQNKFIPATWMIPLKGSFPEPVNRASPNGIGPYLASSWKGWVPALFLIAPETPWGSSNHLCLIGISKSRDRLHFFLLISGNSLYFLKSVCPGCRLHRKISV